MSRALAESQTHWVELVGIVKRGFAKRYFQLRRPRLRRQRLDGHSGARLG